ALPHPRPASTSALSLHDALPIWASASSVAEALVADGAIARPAAFAEIRGITTAFTSPVTTISTAAPPKPSRQLVRPANTTRPERSEEHTSELQSRVDLVCRLLLE